MSLKKNIFANYIGVIGIALAPVLALPWYLETLGSKQFGLVSFIVMFQGLLTLIDAGMSQALVREITVRFDTRCNDQTSTGSLLYGFERVYWIFAIIVSCVTLLFADFIAKHWMNLDGLSINSGKEAIYGAAAIFACQFPGSIYRSLLVGTQKQVTLNSLLLVFTLIRHIGGVIILIRWPILSTYLIWQASIALIETLVRGKFAWKVLNSNPKKYNWNVNELRPVWRMVASLSSVTFLGALTVQMDKLILSRMVSLEQLGYYSIAATVASGVLQLIYPLTQAILPKLIQLKSYPSEIYKINIKLMRLLIFVVGFGTLSFKLIGKWILELWLKNPVTVTEVFPLLTVLLVGTGLNALYNVGYLNWIVHEKIYRVFHVTVLSLVLSVTLIPYFVMWQGTIGAAIGWLLINFIGFMFSCEWLKK